MADNSNNAVASPCVGTCKLDEHTGYCIGCSRTLDEIAFWSDSTEFEKREILKQLPARRAPFYRLKLY